MGKVFTPENINSGFNTNNSLNTNFENIETALEDCLSRSGVAPNAMGADLDMNGYKITNALAISTGNLSVNGSSVPGLSDIQNLYAATQAARDLAGLSELEASASAAAAAASAAGVNLPSLGTAGQMLQVNSGATALENHTPTSTATASAIVRRDASARMQAADPSVDADVATKGYVDGLVLPDVTATGFTRSVATYRTNDANLPGDELSVDTSLSEGASTTVGPTGSGATVIWPRLDDIAADAKTVTLKCIIGGHDLAVPNHVYTELYVGNASGNVLRHEFYNDNGADKLISVETEVVLEAGNIMTLKWLSTATDPEIDVYLTGFTI